MSLASHVAIHKGPALKRLSRNMRDVKLRWHYNLYRIALRAFKTRSRHGPTP